MEKGKLIGLRSYLSGPIDRCPDNGAHWRNRLTPILNKKGVVVLDPLNKPFHSGLENDEWRRHRAESKVAGDYDVIARTMKEIRSIDLRMVDIADFLIAYIDMNIFCCGTMEEIFLANRQKKIVLIVCPQGKQNIPDWFYGTLPHELFFSNFEEALDYLDKVDAGLDVRTFNRWLFPEVSMLYNAEVLGSLTDGVYSSVSGH